MKKIKFNVSSFLRPGNDLDVLQHSEIPQPAKKFIPDWYKDSRSTDKNSIRDPRIKSFKNCVPFADAFITGYILSTPCDIIIENVEGKDPKITLSSTIELFGSRKKESVGLMQIPENCHDVHYIYNHPMHISLPKGYSALITHPLNRNDLPWVALSGVVDMDKEPMRPGQYPIFIKKSAEGLIPKGTPVLQIIPFKRESWKSERNKELIDSFSHSYYKASSVFQNWYRKFGWSRKDYN
jgi:hypothetical protein